MMMNEKRTLAILGGDGRQIAAARRLAQEGYGVYVWGLGECHTQLGDAVLCETWQSAIERAEAIVLPLPASSDGVRIFCPLQDSDWILRVTTVLDAAGERPVLGGRFTEQIRSIAEQKGVHLIDYFESEVLQLRNALPTAEGAIAIAMKELPVTISGIRAAVLGYGRIGALLAERLHAFGARVTVYARRQEQRALAELHHHHAERIVCRGGRSVPEKLPLDCRLIFNTIPKWLLTREELEQLPKNCVLIDLASPPGGIDHTAAKELGIRSVWGTSLPGKCAPESAGYILADTIADIVEDAQHQHRKDE